MCWLAALFANFWCSYFWESGSNIFFLEQCHNQQNQEKFIVLKQLSRNNYKINVIFGVWTSHFNMHHRMVNASQMGVVAFRYQHHTILCGVDNEMPQLPQS